MPAPTKGTILPLEDKPKKRCRKWRIRKRTGRNPVTGRYSECNRVVHGTYSDAEEELEKLNAEIADMRMTPKRRSITVEEMYDEFYAHRVASGEIREKTLESDRSARKAYCPHIGKAFASEVTHQMIDAATAKIIDGGIKRSTAAGYFAKMKLAFDHGKKEGYCTDNPFLRAKKPKSDAEERVAPTEHQIVALAKALTPDDPYHAGVALEMMAGFRVGEAVKANRGDVSLIDDSMLVRGTKTKKSYGTIAICHDLTRFLAAYFDWQDSVLREHGLSPSDDTPIVADVLGRRISKARLQAWWRANRERLGLPDARSHDLRHGWANVLLRRKVPIEVISALMRHSNTKITEDVYLHPDLDFMRGPLDTVSILEEVRDVPEC